MAGLRQDSYELEGSLNYPARARPELGRRERLYLRKLKKQNKIKNKNPKQLGVWHILVILALGRQRHGDRC